MPFTRPFSGRQIIPAPAFFKVCKLSYFKSLLFLEIVKLDLWALAQGSSGMWTLPATGPYSSSTWNWGIYYFVCSHILVSTTALDGIDLWLILMSGHCSLEMLYGKTQRFVSLSVLCHSSAAGMGNRHRRDARENYVPPYFPHTSLC